jgi:hypothetical protein
MQSIGVYQTLEMDVWWFLFIAVELLICCVERSVVVGRDVVSRAYQYLVKCSMIKLVKYENHCSSKYTEKGRPRAP